MIEQAWVELARSRAQESIEAKRGLLNDRLLEQVAEVVGIMVDALRAGGKLLFFGNGGSAADATHLAAEFVGRYLLERDPLPALSLSDNAASVTAISNDHGYDEVFTRQIHAFGRPGDVAIGISTSGTSMSVVAGLLAARGRGLRTVGMTGSSGEQMLAVADVCLCMPTDQTPRIQECYMHVGHTICEIVEQTLAQTSIQIVLLDRDGTLNARAPEGEYVACPDDVVLLPGAAAAVRRLNEASIPVAVVTNQRGISLGRMTADDLDSVHTALRQALAQEGAYLDAIYHCPHEKGTCRCRKPEPGMLQTAVRAFGVAPADAVMIGDTGHDIEAGLAAGISTVHLVGEGQRAHPRAQRAARNLGEAVATLLDAPSERASNRASN